MVIQKIAQYESAHALIDIDREDRSVFIVHLEALDRGLGHGSALLDNLKKEYPDYTLCGNMQPADFSRPQKPSARDMEKAHELGYDFKKDVLCDMGDALASDEKIFAENVAARYRAWKNNDPFGRLHAFYRKNHFHFPAGLGYFESKPPHALYE